MTRNPMPILSRCAWLPLSLQLRLADNLGLNWTATARGCAVFGSITTGASVATSMKAFPCVAALVSTCLPIPNRVITGALQMQ